MGTEYSKGTMTEEKWREILHGRHPRLKSVRRLNRIFPARTRCKVCNAPLTGAGAVMMRMIGYRPYTKNPRFCNACLWRNEVGGIELEITMMFADVRGSTTMAENLSPSEYSALLNRYYKVSTNTLAAWDAWLDNLVGDGIIALFIPGLAGEDHALKAIRSARALLRDTGHHEKAEPWMPIGVGIHTGVVHVGLLGSDGGVSDLTAVGDPMNVAARLCSAASVGEIVVSLDAAGEAGLSASGQTRRSLSLKGKSVEVETIVLGSDSPV